MGTKKKHPGYRKIELGFDVQFQPELAEAKILAAYRAAGANLLKAAGDLDVTERTLHRYVDKLKLRRKLEAVTRDAIKGGWLDSRRRALGSHPDPQRAA